MKLGRILSSIGFIVGALMIMYATGNLYVGQLSVAPYLFIGFGIFAVSVPFYVYWKNRKASDGDQLSSDDLTKLLTKLNVEEQNGEVKKTN